MKLLSVVPLASSLLVAAAATAAPDEAPERVELLPLEARGPAKEVRERLENLLRQETRRLPGVLLSDRSSSSKVSCGFDDLPCLVDVGAKAGAQKVVRARVDKAANGYDLELKVVDVPARVEEGRLKERLDKEPHAHAATVRRMVTQLLVPEHYVGSLLLSVDQAGARVFIDGVHRGTTPLSGPIGGLAPGKHLLELRLAGRPALNRFVVIRFGEVTTESLSFDAPVKTTPPDGHGQGNGTQSTAISQQVEVPVPEPAGVDESELVWLGAGGAVAGLGVVALGGAAVTAAITFMPPSLPSNPTDKDIENAVTQRRMLWGTSGALVGMGLLAVAVGGTLSAVPLMLQEEPQEE